MASTALARRLPTQPIDAEPALAAAASLQPDVVLLDIVLPDRSGLLVAEQLVRVANPPRVVLISSRSRSDFGPSFVCRHRCRQRLARLADRGSRIADRGSRIADRGSRIAVTAWLLALALQAPAYSQVALAYPAGHVRDRIEREFLVLAYVVSLLHGRPVHRASRRNADRLEPGVRDARLDRQPEHAGRARGDLRRDRDDPPTAMLHRAGTIARDRLSASYCTMYATNCGFRLRVFPVMPPAGTSTVWPAIAIGEFADVGSLRW
jgi:CheY-like chemotaxis protein